MPKKNPEREAKRQRHKELTEFLDSVGVSDAAGVQELFKDLVSSVLQNGLEGELEEELGYSKYDYRNKETDNSRNGYSEKTVHSSFGDIELSVPRDRKGEYEPQLVKKHQTSLSGDIEEKILSMYAKGMSTSDIEAHIQDICGLSTYFKYPQEMRTLIYTTNAIENFNTKKWTGRRKDWGIIHSQLEIYFGDRTAL